MRGDYWRRLWRALTNRPLPDAEEVDRQQAIQARLRGLRAALTQEVKREIELAWDIHGNALLIFEWNSPWAIVTQLQPEDLANKGVAKKLGCTLEYVREIPAHSLGYCPKRGVQCP